MSELKRYARINSHMPREFLLLQGTGCLWRRCAFCDYHLDVSREPFAVNRPVIDRITGDYGVVDVINSGSAFEMDSLTLHYLREKLYEKDVKTLWLECHWLYRERLEELRQFFEGIEVNFRLGVESFDGALRQAWNKGVPQNVSPADMARYFQGACLLVCVQGQTREGIIRDLQLAWEHFQYFSVNVFVENSTALRQDRELAAWFAARVAPELQKYDKIEVLLENTDLGVG